MGETRFLDPYFHHYASQTNKKTPRARRARAAPRARVVRAKIDMGSKCFAWLDLQL
jgi:hypothetical protein